MDIRRAQAIQPITATEAEWSLFATDAEVCWCSNFEVKLLISDPLLMLSSAPEVSRYVLGLDFAHTLAHVTRLGVGLWKIKGYSACNCHAMTHSQSKSVVI